eukprot:gene3383-6712_t
MLNLIFILTDDLRTELSIYGRQHVHSPNFERLSRHGLTFDHAYCQVPVCFPSRHSLLTGLRPDTTNVHGFYSSPSAGVNNLYTTLISQNYYSASVGKVFHGTSGSSAFPDGLWEGNWYRYQNKEQSFLNSSVTPDDTIPEEHFRDYIIADHAINKLHSLVRKSNANNRPFSLSIGFKQPHLQYHIPRKYYELYYNNSFLNNILQYNKSSNKYPLHTPLMNYRCCAGDFRPMNDEGRSRAKTKSSFYGNMRISNPAHMELMWGYLAGISFLDAQLGRVLDTLDELQLWNTSIIVFTSDHGMHVGEKGMWEKYTLFEETTRVPLIIADPRYPEQWGARFRDPVEILDTVPTILDLLNINITGENCPTGRRCAPWDGRSRAPAIRQSQSPPSPRPRPQPLEQQKEQHQSEDQQPVSEDNDNIFDSNVTNTNNTALDNFAISQIRRCKPFQRDQKHVIEGNEIIKEWDSICNYRNKGVDSVMGYSLRTLLWRYTAWYNWDDRRNVPVLTEYPYAEEFYDHRRSGVSDLESEQRNDAFSNDSSIIFALMLHRKHLLEFLRKQSNISSIA